MSAVLTPVMPVRYEPSVEVPADDEQETLQGLVETMTKIQSITFKDEGHALRPVHAKSYGLLNAMLTVPVGLPPHLAQGLFATPAQHPVVMRFSAVPGDLLDDKISTPRGLSIKILGVEGERLPGSEAASTQDFVMINGPAFGAPTPKKFLGNVKLLAATTDKAPGLKKAFSAALQQVEKVIEATGHKSATIVSLGGHPETNVLGETYWTAVPLRFGDYIAKLQLVPVSAELKALTDAKVDLHDRPNGLRDAVVAHFLAHGGTWELRAQLNVDLEAMPIEDASVEWPEDRSPYVTVARIVAEPQPAWNEERSVAVDDGLSFSPWHGLAAHRPLGGVMRVRRRVYEEAVRFRAQHNGRAIGEPGPDFMLP
jgi:hypothetical protein